MKKVFILKFIFYGEACLIFTLISWAFNAFGGLKRQMARVRVELTTFRYLTWIARAGL